MSYAGQGLDIREMSLPHAIEVGIVGELDPDRPTIVMLHHGLGSVSAWREFPESIARATGLATVAYSRRGYGRSAATGTLPWPASFMHDEAEGDLPRLLQALDIRQPILLGHSDGASIALIYAAAQTRPRPLGTVLLAPHVHVEAVTLTGARQAAVDFKAGDLRARLARHHRDPEAAFRGWNETWLSEDFRGWNIEQLLDSVHCPVLVVQGLADPYGSLAQVRPIRERVAAPVEVLLIAGGGHAPERERPLETIDSVVAFAAELDDSPATLPARIYHLTTAEELRAGLDPNRYAAAHLEAEGFVHCTSSPATTLAVADDLFAGDAPLVLQIDSARLGAAVKMEPPAPVAGRTAHRRFASSFPHVYGTIDRMAICAIGKLERAHDRFVWPRELLPVDEALERI